MRIKKLGCQYFQRFGEYNEIEFDETQKIIGIVGSYNDNSNKSNRSGKTTFVEMILYGLYGKGRVRSESDLINFNYRNDMLVNLVLEHNSEEIEIERGKNIDNSSVLNVNGFEGMNKTDIQNEIDKILGVDYKDFLTTYFFQQDDIHSFMKSGSNSKKEMIIKWIEKDYWKELEKASKEKLSTIQDSIKSCEGFLKEFKVIDVEELKEELKGLKEEELKMKRLLQKIEKEYQELSNIISNIESEDELQKQLENTEQNIKKLKKKLYEYNDTIDKNAEYNTEKNKKLFKKDIFEKIDEKVDVLDKEQYSHLLEESKLQSEKRDIEHKLIRLKQTNGICPLTNLDCNILQSDKAEIEFRDKLNTINENLKQYNSISIRAEIDRLKKQKKELIRYSSYKEAKENKEEITKQLKAFKEEKQKIEGKLSESNDDLYDKLEEKLKEKQRTKKEQDKIISSIGSKEKEIEYTLENNKKIEKYKKQVENYKKMESYWKFISFMYGKNGIPSSIINETLQEVQDETNLILEKLGAPLSIEFSSLKELKQWEERCIVCGKLFEPREKGCGDCGSRREKKVKDELSLRIYEGDKETDFDQDSGGGKVLISVAIRFALMRMLIRKSNSKIRFVVLDEVFGMLDKVYRKSMLDLIVDFVINELNMEQVFIISHTDISDLVEDIITITRHKDYSLFSWT